MPKPASAREQLMRWLARRDYSAAELRRKLQQKQFPAEQIELLISDFIEKGYIDDARFAEVFVRHRIGSGYGPKRIEQELLYKGVDREVVVQALQQGNDDGYSQGLRRYLSRYRQASADAQERNKRLRYLLGRGYSGDTAKRLMDEAENLLRSAADSGQSLQ